MRDKVALNTWQRCARSLGSEAGEVAGRECEFGERMEFPPGTGSAAGDGGDAMELAGKRHSYTVLF